MNKLMNTKEKKKHSMPARDAIHAEIKTKNPK
jgi:hypothetical protein